MGEMEEVAQLNMGRHHRRQPHGTCAGIYRPIEEAQRTTYSLLMITVATRRAMMESAQPRREPLPDDLELGSGTTPP